MRNFNLESAIYFSLLMYAFIAPISIAGQSIFTILAILLAIVDIVKKKRLPEFEWRRLKGIGVFLLLLIYSAVLSLDTSRSFNVVWTYVARLLLVFPVVFYIKERRQVETILVSYAAGWSIASLFALYQWAFKGIRAIGFYSHPMMLGDCLTIAVPLFLALAVAGDRTKLRRWGGVAFILTALALLANDSRGAWLAMLAIPPILLFTFGKKIKSKMPVILALVIFLVVAVGLVFNSHFQQRVASIADPSHPSNQNRIWLWQSAFKLWQEHPLNGVGLGNYEENFQKYLSPRSEFYGGKANAHNIYMQILAEAGVLGPIILLYMYYTLVRQHSSGLKNGRQEWARAVALGALLFTTTLALQGVVEYNLGSAPVARQFWFLTALAFACYQINEEDTALKQPRK